LFFQGLSASATPGENKKPDEFSFIGILIDVGNEGPEPYL